MTSETEDRRTRRLRELLAKWRALDDLNCELCADDLAAVLDTEGDRQVPAHEWEGADELEASTQRGLYHPLLGGLLYTPERLQRLIVELQTLLTDHADTEGDRPATDFWDECHCGRSPEGDEVFGLGCCHREHRAKARKDWQRMAGEQQDTIIKMIRERERLLQRIADTEGDRPMPEAPYCEKHGTMVARDESGSRWYCAVCGADTEGDASPVRDLRTRFREALARHDPPPPTMADAAEMLWIVLANVSGGNWNEQSQEWQEAAARWRDYYFAALPDPPVQP